MHYDYDDAANDDYDDNDDDVDDGNDKGLFYSFANNSPTCCTS